MPLPRATMYISRLSSAAVCGMLPVILHLKLEPLHPNMPSLLNIHTNPYPSTRLTRSLDISPLRLVSLHPPSLPYLTLPSFLPSAVCTALHPTLIPTAHIKTWQDLPLFFLLLPKTTQQTLYTPLTNPLNTSPPSQSRIQRSTPLLPPSPLVPLTHTIHFTCNALA